MEVKRLFWTYCLEMPVATRQWRFRPPYRAVLPPLKYPPLPRSCINISMIICYRFPVELSSWRYYMFSKEQFLLLLSARSLWRFMCLMVVLSLLVSVTWLKTAERLKEVAPRCFSSEGACYIQFQAECLSVFGSPSPVTFTLQFSELEDGNPKSFTRNHEELFLLVVYVGIIAK